MRRILNLVLFLFIATISFSFFGGKGKSVEWKLGHNANTDHIWHETAVKFSEIVDEKTDGKLKVKIFPNGQLGSETDMINSVRLGTLDMVLTGETLQNWAPKAALMAVPYAFRDLDHMNTVLNGPIGEEIKTNIQANAGLIPLYYHERAPRNLTTNRDIKSVEDLKGLIIRVPDVPIFVKTWEVLGAKPTPMSLQEVFTSLQQNTIHAQENPYDLVYSLGFYEVQKNAYETEHVIQWIYATVGEKQFNKLSPEMQKAVLEASEEAQIYAQGKFKDFVVTAKQNLIDKGMKIIPVNKEEYQNKIMPEMQKILTPEQYELYLKIVETK
ncbi:MAG: TRAP transporter substrate-binding protein [Cetobacterium sp.]|uniref:TRAP transporter substrate-binding protein n=1 Tax=uncultured Cetobacterium sp. TaxID=527638 RepID=UPI0025E38D86|nr:TRAP transporter substrate-binding protein [uncultured Cetobacterium sp.]